MSLWLNESDVRELLSPGALIAAMENALVAYSEKRAAQPVRTVIECGERSFFASMPVRIANPAAMGAKLVTIFPGNAALGKPTHLASIALLDPETGELLAMLDGRYITEARTAAVSAVSVRHLACPDSGVLALIGSGVQARSHLEFLCHVRPFEEVRFWSPNRARLCAFAESARGVRACDSAQQAAENAGVIVLATSSSVPVIESDWVRPGALVIAVGACRPRDREAAPALLKKARLIVDSRESALKESGDVVMAIDEGWFDETHIAAELGEVIAGTKPGRVLPSEIVVFKSLGLAVEDIFAAHLVYREARLRGRGLELRQC